MARSNSINDQLTSVIYKSKKELDVALFLIEDIPNAILDQMVKDDKPVFTSCFYLKLLQATIELVDDGNERDRINIEGIRLAGSFILSIRNTFYSSQTNQENFGSNDDVIDSTLQIVKCIFSDESYTRVKDYMGRPLDSKLCEWLAAHAYCASALVTLLSNLMVNNHDNTVKLTPILMPYIQKLLSYPNLGIGVKSSSILYHFLRNSTFWNHVEDYRKYIDLSFILSLYKSEYEHSCFVLFCLEYLLCFDQLLSDHWSQLDEIEILIALDVLSSIESEPDHPRRKGGVPKSIVEFCKEQFKVDTDKVLCNKHLESLQPRVLSRLTSFLCNCASNFNQHLMQMDKSCLISTVYLLRAFTQAADDGSELHARLTDLSDVDGINEEAETNPSFGFKTDLIKLIASLVYRNKENQDIVRDSGGISLLLTNSQYDGKNPLIREASVLSIRNLLEGNIENQKIVEQLACLGGVQNPLLEQMGAKVKLENGKPKIENNR